MCVCVCVCGRDNICLGICLSIYFCVSVSTCVITCVCICVAMCLCMSLYVCVYACRCVCVFMHVSVCVCVCMSLCVCVCVCACRCYCDWFTEFGNIPHQVSMCQPVWGATVVCFRVSTHCYTGNTPIYEHTHTHTHTHTYVHTVNILWHVCVCQPEMHPGKCWAFKGSQGFLTIALSLPVRVTHVTLEHIPKSLSPTGRIDSAPREFAVYVSLRRPFTNTLQQQIG